MVITTLLIGVLIIGCLMKCIQAVLGRFVQSVVEGGGGRGQYVELNPFGRSVDYQNIRNVRQN